MLGTQLVHFFHRACTNLSSKSQLAELRKKTGYTFANCKKALETNNHDIVKAEQWLKEQAQALGWAKAAKLQGRATSQGLIGVAVDNTTAAIVEVNCETDFVAKNDKFKSFVQLVANSCLEDSKKLSNFSNNIAKTYLESLQLKDIVCSDGKTLGDHSALVVGSVGENLILTRALCLAVSGNLKVAGFAHPPLTDSSMPVYGKYGALAVLETARDEETVDKIGKQLCQHIIGMNPSKIGSTEDDKESDDPENESTLIYQEFLIDSEVTVQEVLEKENIKIVDFVRFECSEEQKSENTTENIVAEQSG